MVVRTFAKDVCGSRSMSGSRRYRRKPCNCTPQWERLSDRFVLEAPPSYLWEPVLAAGSTCGWGESHKRRWTLLSVILQGRNSPQFLCGSCQLARLSSLTFIRYGQTWPVTVNAKIMGPMLLFLHHATNTVLYQSLMLPGEVWGERSGVLFARQSLPNAKQSKLYTVQDAREETIRTPA